jgi:uncharacterized protein
LAHLFKEVLVKLEGSHTINAPRDKVWHLILDPKVLAICTPGVKTMEAAGEDKYKATLELGIGPVRGQFAGNVQVTEKNYPDTMTLSVDGSGGPGGLKAVGKLRLEEQDGKTIVHYEGEPQISGRLAAVGSRLVGGIAKQLAGQFFEKLNVEAQKA